MSTKQIHTDPRYHIGKSQDTKVAATPNSTKFEVAHTGSPPGFIPSRGTNVVFNCFSTLNAGVVGLVTDLSLYFKLRNNSTEPGVAIQFPHISKLLKSVVIKIDNVELLNSSGLNEDFINYCRNLMLDTRDLNEFNNRWVLSGHTFINDAYLRGVKGNNILLFSGEEGEVKLDLNYLLPIFKKLPTTFFNKITVEVQFKNTPSDIASAFDFGFFMGSSVITDFAYDRLEVTHCEVHMSQQLYSDLSLIHPISQPLVSLMRKLEHQSFELGGTLSTGGAARTISIRLADNFSLRKRISAVHFALRPISTTTGQTILSRDLHLSGTNWAPQTLRSCEIIKGGKSLKNYDSPQKVSRQALKYWKSMGAEWEMPLFESNTSTELMDDANVGSPGNTTAAGFNTRGWCGGDNVVAFTDDNVYSISSEWVDNLDLVQGIANSQSENYVLNCNFQIPANGVVNPANGFSSTLDVYIVYAEILELRSTGHSHPVETRIYS